MWEIFWLGVLGVVGGTVWYVVGSLMGDHWKKVSPLGADVNRHDWWILPITGWLGLGGGLGVWWVVKVVLVVKGLVEGVPNGLQ